MENTTVIQNWKALIKPNKLNIKSNEDKTITTLTAEPLEKGYALTIGNSLRRILLSSIQGSAITAIQIDGVLHEFSSIKGVREDVTDIVLNVKSLALKSNADGPKKLILEITGPGEFKAKDINKNNDNILIYQIIRDSIDLMVKDLIKNTIHNLKKSTNSIKADTNNIQANMLMTKSLGGGGDLL